MTQINVKADLQAQPREPPEVSCPHPPLSVKTGSYLVNTSPNNVS